MDHDTTPTGDDRREGEAVRNARQRIALLAETVGTRHPDYATGLNQLALLLIMQGDPDSAEPLLREAMEIRREALGEAHPDFATNLSSLGGLLWARGSLAEAEPLLRRAAEVRLATLGPDHPKTVVSRSSLEQLHLAMHAAEAPAPGPEPAAAEAVAGPASPPSPVRAGPAEPGDDESFEALESDLGRVSHTFAALGERLASAAALLASGRVPPDDLADAASAARREFEALKASAEAHASGLGVELPPAGLNALAEVSEALPRLEEAHDRRRRSREVRGRVATALRPVAGLACPSDPEFAPLARCREEAARLLALAESAGPGEVHPDLRPLLDDDHPFRALLGLVTADDSVADTRWADWYDAVEARFGPDLAVAAARSRILADASPVAAAS